MGENISYISEGLVFNEKIQPKFVGLGGIQKMFLLYFKAQMQNTVLRYDPYQIPQQCTMEVPMLTYGVSSKIALGSVGIDNFFS